MAFNATAQQDYIGHSRQKLWGIRQCGCCRRDLFVKQNFDIVKVTCRCVEVNERCLICNKCIGCHSCGGTWVQAGLY